ncbi:MAG: hypothetical protein Q9218_005312 [Villophora microphyllina]
MEDIASQHAVTWPKSSPFDIQASIREVVSRLVSLALSVLGGEEHGLPQIELDTTLAELYNHGRPQGSGPRIGFVASVTNSEVDQTSKFIRNTKYLYQDSTFINTPIDMPPEQRQKLRRDVAVKYQSLIAQHDAFAAGNMPVIFVDPDVDSPEGAICSIEEDAERTMESLTKKQRPHVRCYAALDQISLGTIGSELLTSKAVLDGLDGMPLAVDLDTISFLNSKAALCESGLPSPKTALVELNAYSDPPEYCCDVCRSSSGSVTIPSGCNGSRKTWLNNNIARTMSQIAAQRLPFVLKNQQTFGGGGTFVIETQKEFLELQSALSTRILPKLYSQVNVHNAHLKPATLIVSEMVRDPIGDWGLTFFVTRTGECIFLAVTQQTVDSSKAYIGSTISYTAQDKLKEKFTPIMHQIGAWLSSYGYYGPCGADILETAPGQGSNDGGNFHIVDLNVRTTGSLVICLLSSHFSKRRGLHEASAFAISVKMTRDGFISYFRRQMEEGRIVIASWYEDRSSGVSYGKVIVGAETQDALAREVAKIKDVAPEIHF